MNTKVTKHYETKYYQARSFCDFESGE